MLSKRFLGHATFFFFYTSKHLYIDWPSQSKQVSTHSHKPGTSIRRSLHYCSTAGIPCVVKHNLYHITCFFFRAKKDKEERKECEEIKEIRYVIIVHELSLFHCSEPHMYFAWCFFEVLECLRTLCILLARWKSNRTGSYTKTQEEMRSLPAGRRDWQTWEGDRYFMVQQKWREIMGHLAELMWLRRVAFSET